MLPVWLDKPVCLALALVVWLAVAAGCGGDGSGGGGGAPGSALPRGSEPVDLDPADFSVAIDNPYWPMTPGSRWVYRESDGEGRVQRVVVTVTGEKKRIANGIEARVVHDVVS